MTKTTTPIFDETALGKEIIRVWGLHGAHMEVFKMMQAQRTVLESDRARLLALAKSRLTARMAELPRYDSTADNDPEVIALRVAIAKATS